MLFTPWRLVLGMVSVVLVGVQFEVGICDVKLGHHIDFILFWWIDFAPHGLFMLIETLRQLHNSTARLVFAITILKWYIKNILLLLWWKWLKDYNNSRFMHLYLCLQSFCFLLYWVSRMIITYKIQIAEHVVLFLLYFWYQTQKHVLNF